MTCKEILELSPIWYRLTCLEQGDAILYLQNSLSSIDGDNERENENKYPRNSKKEAT